VTAEPAVIAPLSKIEIMAGEAVVVERVHATSDRRLPYRNGHGDGGAVSNCPGITGMVERLQRGFWIRTINDQPSL
jgi:hypothetical protein